jgi:1-deoxy-D-xylulose-5-phosphate reductoisomerase
MTFEVPDHARFPGLPLAWEVLNAPVGSTAVLNAANEVAVAAFLNKQIRFDQIHQVNQVTLDAVAVSNVSDIEGLLALDARARLVATQLAGHLEL